jgi:hypothetical protein
MIAVPFLSRVRASTLILSEAVGIAEESPKSLAAVDEAISTRWCEAFWRNQPIVKTLVIPFPVTIRRECSERSA